MKTNKLAITLNKTLSLRAFPIALPSSNQALQVKSVHGFVASPWPTYLKHPQTLICKY